MRLSTATLAQLPASVVRPGYNRGAIQTGVVHLGLGAFHRAHQALVFEAALASGDRRWGVTGASLRSSDVRDRLQPQDSLYTVTVRRGEEEKTQAVGAIRNVLVVPEAPAGVVDLLSSAAVHLVTLTVTEKGYAIDSASGGLRRDDPLIAADLRDLSAPRSVPGLLVAGLARRHRAGRPPFTAMSCDNLPSNGQRLRAAVIEMADAHNPALARWIADEGAFPATMVDRIVPASTDPALAHLARRIGVEDAGAVFTEPFFQWVIEDCFCGPCPDFAALGVELTDHVEGWEEAKLRLLNGAHSAMAYLGGLAGIEYVHDIVERPEGRSFVEALWDESVTTLSPPHGMDVAAYRHALLERFANPALRHRLVQIAADGSQKLPQRLVAPFAARIARDEPVHALALGIAAWMLWQRGRLDDGRAFAIDDPLAGQTHALLEEARTADAVVRALLTLRAVFPAELASDHRVRDALVLQLDRLLALGARGALEAFASQRERAS